MSSRMGVRHPLRRMPALDDDDVRVIDGLRIHRWWYHHDVLHVERPWLLDGVRIDDAGDVDGITWSCVEAGSHADLVERIPGFLAELLDEGVELSPRFLARLNGVRDAEAVASLGRSDAERRIGS
jgi:hypothetical protein